MNPTATYEHPSAADLQAFALGRLDGLAVEWLEAHLASCESCSRQLAAVPDDHLLKLAREASTQSFHSALTLSHNPWLATVPAELANHPRYRVIRLLGTGGMGAVYQAEHQLMERMVALKVISPEFTANPQAVERFQREVKAAARLSHPNIVRAFDAEQAGGRHILAMEYVEGVCLDDYVARQGPLAPHVACDFIRQAALGLAHANEQGMTHRDIKPHNLIVTPRGEVKILDFGLARLHDAPPTARGPGDTMAGMVLGTPEFMAPEQIRDARSADIRADIYSLGCTLYYLLTGRPPFEAGSAIEMLSAHLHMRPPLASNYRNDLPPELLQVLDRMLAKNVADRFQTPGEVAEALVPLTKPVETQPTPARANPSLHPSRRWVVMVGITTAALLLAGVVLSQSGLPHFMLSGFGGLKGQKVLFVVPQQQAWYADYGPTKERLEAAGVQVITASSEAGPCQTLNDTRWPDAPPIVADVSLAQASADDYDAVLFSGYQVTPFFGERPDSATVAKLLQDFRQQRKTVAAICAGQAVLAQHNVLDGKKGAGGENLAASFPYEVPGGPRWTNQPVEVVDGDRIITASDDRHAVEFADAIIAALRP